jgi:hypothetical protein
MSVIIVRVVRQEVIARDVDRNMRDKCRNKCTGERHDDAQRKRIRNESTERRYVHGALAVRASRVPIPARFRAFTKP